MQNSNKQNSLSPDIDVTAKSRHFIMVTEGLPGPGYHGGAVACWAVLKSMIARGHTATVVGLMSVKNPYDGHRDEQLNFLADLGVAVKLVDLDLQQETTSNESVGSTSRVGQLLNLFDYRSNQRLNKFEGVAKNTIENTRSDGIFCYHFETVYALGQEKLNAPITVCAVDLYHLSPYFRLREQPFSLKKITKDMLVQWAFSRAMKKFMVMIYQRCAVKIEFAPHYAAWFRSQRGCEDTLYIPTPVHDPVGTVWKEVRDARRRKKQIGVPKILMIGDIGGTATTSGLRLCRDAVFPALERALGPDGFEVHLVGGGTLAPEFEEMGSKPYIKLRGRIMPPDDEFLSSNIVLVPTPHTLGVRVRIINAFSYGCCVVSHIGNQAGIPEMENGVNSLIGRNGNQLAEEILRIVRNPGLSETIGNEARSSFETHFAENVAGDRVVKLMEQAAVDS